LVFGQDKVQMKKICLTDRAYKERLTACDEAYHGQPLILKVPISS